MKTIQTNCIQTQIDDVTGRLIGYRLTLPVPKSFADVCESKYIVRGRNKVFYFTFENSDFDTVTKVKLEAQIKINGMKIHALQQRHVALINKHSRI